MQDKIEGRNPVMEALRADVRIDKIYVRRGEARGSLIPLLKAARDKRIPIVEADAKKLDAMSETGAHQGVVAQCAAVEYAEVEDVLALAQKRGEPPLIVILDKMNDPRNLGSIIRSANCAGAHGVIIGKHASVTLTAAAAKASAGAVSHTPVVRAANLARTVEQLQKAGVWVAAADMSGDKTLYDDVFSGALAIVVGGEGEGVSRLLLEKCDFKVRIPMRGEINSLNASVAAALLLFRAAQTRESERGR